MHRSLKNQKGFMIADAVCSIGLILVFMILMLPFLINTTKVDRLELKQASNMSILAQMKMASLTKMNYADLSIGTKKQYFPINDTDPDKIDTLKITDAIPSDTNHYMITWKITYVNPDSTNTDIANDSSVKKVTITIEGPFLSNGSKNKILNRDSVYEITTLKCDHESTNYFDKG